MQILITGPLYENIERLNGLIEVSQPDVVFIIGPLKLSRPLKLNLTWFFVRGKEDDLVPLLKSNGIDMLSRIFQFRNGITFSGISGIYHPSTIKLTRREWMKSRGKIEKHRQNYLFKEDIDSFVEAFRKTPEGPVIYNPHVCIGCRYCMVACPFDRLGYEYYDPWTPQVTKCTMCYDRIVEGKVPACVEVCTAGALIFGKRSELIKIARERIANNPDKYVNHIYGEHEVGGTSWLYISPVPFEEIGFRMDLGTTPIPEYGENFLFAVKLFEIVGAWPLVFGAYYQISKEKKKKQNPTEEKGEGHGKK